MHSLASLSLLVRLIAAMRPASYAFYATRAQDNDMGDIWVLKVVKEYLDEQGKSA